MHPTSSSPKNTASTYRWWIMGIVALAYILSFFQRFAPAGIAHDLAASFQISATSLGALASMYFYVYTLTQIPTGILADTWGARKLLLAGGIVGGIGSLLFGLAPSFTWALAGRILIGLGVSVTFIAMLKLIAVWFEESRFATLVGLCMFIGNLGSVLAGTPLTKTAGLIGWRSVFVGVGVLSLVLGLLCWFIVRDRPAQHDANTPTTAPRLSWAQVGAHLRTIITNRRTLAPLLVNIGMSGSFFTFAGLWAMPYLTQVHHMSRAVAAQHLSIWAMGFAIGCLFVGSLSDRIGRRKPVMMVIAHLYVLMWLVLYHDAPLHNGWGYAFFAVLGILTSGFSLTWACAKEVNPPQLSGMSTSIANMGGFLTAALMQPLVGWVMDQGWQGTLINGVRIYDVYTWQTGVACVAAVAALGALGTWFLHETSCRNVWRG